MMFYLFMNFLSSNAAQIASFYVEKTHESPKSSCVEISNILGIERCAVKCLNTIATIYMFSVNKNQRKCLCCPNLTGSDITDPEWESFIPPACATGYATYNYTDIQICLKYVSVPASYPEAAELCEAEGGDLIRLDSQLKHDIMTNYLVPIANGSTIDVWIQGEKYAGGYIFHDGSPFPSDFGTGTFCPVELNPDPNEIRFRAHGSTTFECWDRAQHHLYSYLCEYYRRFTI